MKVLITGATGLIGKEIVNQLIEKKITVHYLSTQKDKLKNETFYKGFFWDINSQIIDKQAFEGISHIIHLAGARISKRWTKTYKKEIIESRILYTQLLFDFLKNNSNEVKHITFASAIGIYKSDYSHLYSENEILFSNSFLSEVVQKWENVTEQFKLLNLQHCTIRIGLVMSKNGGIFPQIIAPIKYGLGAIMGNGEQWQSWIYINDLARIFVCSLEKNLIGIYNGVAPNPINNKEMTKILAKTIKKPLFLPNIPQFMMKIILGEMHHLLFESQKVNSKKIIDAGFEFEFTDFEDVAKELLKVK
jgi:uncharacterized protein (TIGR01777 family)